VLIDIDVCVEVFEVFLVDDLLLVNVFVVVVIEIDGFYLLSEYVMFYLFMMVVGFDWYLFVFVFGFGDVFGFGEEWLVVMCILI